MEGESESQPALVDNRGNENNLNGTNNMNENTVSGEGPDSVNVAPSATSRSQYEDAEVDDDEWSRHVETDEVPAVPESFRMESVLEQESNDDNSATAHQSHNIPSNSDSRPVLRPSQPELTMKEKLVLRERERRIETERARLKRQFALSNNPPIEDGMEGVTLARGENTSDFVEGDVGGTTESVATLGEESTMVHPDEESAQQPALPVTMERFLRNSDSFNPQLEPTNEETLAKNTNTDGTISSGTPVLMERFLNDPVVAAPVPASQVDSTNDDNVQRSVSFDVDMGATAVTQTVSDASQSHDVNSSLVGADISVDANTSVQVQPDEDAAAVLEGTIASSDDTPLHDMTTSSVTANASAPEEPRVLRLTEADMQEMAATEEESIANYPPSERDDNLSEVGELADFPMTNHLLPRGDVSQDTPTTAVDSYAGSEKPPSAVSSDRHSLDASANDDTVAAQPPSERDILSPVMDVSERRQVEVSEDMKQPPLPGIVPNNDSNHDSDDDDDEPKLVNRRLRPGMPGLMSTSVPAAAAGVRGVNNSNSAAMQKAVVVDDFDFDKGAPKSPGIDNDSYRDLPDDVRGFPSEMQVSPIASDGKRVVSGGNTADYGALEEGQVVRATPRRLDSNTTSPRMNLTKGERAPLLGDVPPEIITTREKREGRVHRESLNSLGQSIRSRLNSVFSDVRSEEEDEKVLTQNESQVYSSSSTLARAFPERIFALTITLILEIPVLLMISGGSDALCELVGRKRYQLLISFIPLTSAISGNVGLQASTLTTRAISHTHVTGDDFLPWLGKEIGAACYLGIGMGVMLGLIAFAASQLDFAFALTILIAQFVSILTAGCTGTIAPLLFSFIFKRDSGKWGGPLETAVQDIVGSFAMVIMSYHLLKWLGPGPIGPDDVCGGS